MNLTSGFEFIYDADTKWLAITKAAEIYACHIEMTGKTKIAFCFKNGIHLHKAITQVLPFTHIICNCFP